MVWLEEEKEFLTYTGLGMNKNTQISLLCVCEKPLRLGGEGLLAAAPTINYTNYYTH